MGRGREISREGEKERGGEGEWCEVEVLLRDWCSSEGIGVEDGGVRIEGTEKVKGGRVREGSYLQHFLFK